MLPFQKKPEQATSVAAAKSFFTGPYEPEQGETAAHEASESPEFESGESGPAYEAVKALIDQYGMDAVSGALESCKEGDDNYSVEDTGEDAGEGPLADLADKQESNEVSTKDTTPAGSQGSGRYIKKK